MPKSDVFENALFLLIFNGAALADLAENDSSSPATTLTFALHTADPGDAGDMTTSEAGYTGYVRQTVNRNSGGFTVTADVVATVADVLFPASTGAGTTITHFSIGTGVGDNILYRGTLTPTIPVADGTAPKIIAGAVITGGTVAAVGGDNAPTIDNQSFEYGTATPDQQAGYVVIPDEGTVTSIAINSASLGTASDFETVGDKIQTSIGNSFSSDTTLNCTATFSDASTDDFVATITAVTGISVSTDAEAKSAAEGSLAYGDNIYIRAGSYNAAEADYRWKRTSGFTGTFNGSNWVTVQPHAGEVPTIVYLRVDNVNNIEPAFRFTNLRFVRPTVTGNGNGAGCLMVINSGNKTCNMKIDNCHFESTVGLVPTPGIPFVGAFTGISFANSADDVIIEDNTITGVYDGIFITGDRVQMNRNVITEFWNDGIKFGGSDIEIHDNIMSLMKTVDIPDPDTLHPDGIQYLGGAHNEDNISIKRNTISGVPHAAVGLQGIFIDDTTSGFSVTNLIIEGNRVYNAGYNQIYVLRGEGAIIRGNTAVNALDVSASVEARIVLRTCTDCVVEYNIGESIGEQDGGTNNIIANNTIVDHAIPSTYSAVFADAKDGALMLDLSTELNIVASSAPDTASPKHGAHQDYFNYAANTQNPPWNLPSLSSSVPADGATGIATTANIVLTFNTNVIAVAGKNLVIKNTATDATVQTIAANDAAVTIVNNVVTINPSDFGSGLGLYLTADIGAFIGTDGQDWAGISAKTDLNWTVAAADVTAPVFASSTPADDATGIAITVNPTITFTEANTLSFATSKTFEIYNVTDTVSVKTFSTATDIGSGPGKMSLSGKTVTLEPISDLLSSKEYAIKWDAGAVKDDSANDVAANTSNTLVSFTTAAVSSGPNMVHFDGSDSRTLSGGMTSAERVYFHFRCIRDDNTTGYKICYGGGFGNRFRISVDESGSFYTFMKNSSGSNAFTGDATSDIFQVADGNSSVLFAIDNRTTGGVGKCCVYVNKVLEHTYNTAATGAIDTSDDIWVGGDSASAGDLVADLGNVAIGTHTWADVAALGATELDPFDTDDLTGIPTSTHQITGNAAAWNTGDMSGAVTDV